MQYNLLIKSSIIKTNKVQYIKTTVLHKSLEILFKYANVALLKKKFQKRNRNIGLI